MSQTSPQRSPAARKDLPEHLKAYRHVWVFVEYEHGKVHPVSLELLGEGRKLADKLQVDLAGVVLGGSCAQLGAVADLCFESGADVAYLVSDPVLEGYRNDPYTKVMTDLVDTHKPEILLLGATTLGRDLAGSVATTLRTGLTADCTELAIDDERSLAATRPTFGGSLLCTIHTLNYRPQMASVRPRVFPAPARVPGRRGRIVEHGVGVAENEVATKILEFLPDRTSEESRLPFADIVVAGGMGLRNQDNFRLIAELADLLGGEYGGTRPVVQKGWLAPDRQIGQTGKTIRPRLYIAAGISGAIQHRVGVEGADLIVAINSDPDAPIFEFAHLGVVADAASFLRTLTTVLRERIAHLAPIREAA